MSSRITVRQNSIKEKLPNRQYSQRILVYHIGWCKSICGPVSGPIYSHWYHSGTGETREASPKSCRKLSFKYSGNFPCVEICNPQCSPVLWDIFSVHLHWATSGGQKECWAEDIMPQVSTADFFHQFFKDFATPIFHWVRVVDPINRGSMSTIATVFLWFWSVLLNPSDVSVKYWVKIFK